MHSNCVEIGTFTVQGRRHKVTRRLEIPMVATRGYM